MSNICVLVYYIIVYYIYTYIYMYVYSCLYIYAHVYVSRPFCWVLWMSRYEPSQLPISF